MKRRGAIAGAIAAAATMLAVVFGLTRPELAVRYFNPQGAYEIDATQDLAFKAAPRDSDRWGAADSLADTIAHIRERMRKHRGSGTQFDFKFVLRAKDTMEYSRARLLDPTLDALRKRLRKADVGQVWYIRALFDDYTFRSAKFDLNPAMVIDTEGTRPVDIIVGSTVVRFPKASVIGIYACKYIYGTHTLSQHALGGGNAVDWGGSTALLDAIAGYQMRLIRKDYLPVSQLLWQGHNLLSGSSVYDHFDHVHDSGLPLLEGTHCEPPGMAGVPEGAAD